MSTVSGLIADTWIEPDVLAQVVDLVGTPTFLYNESRLISNASRILRAAEKAEIGHRLKPFIPFFPNSNPHLFKPLHDLGMGALVQLPSEHAILRRFGVTRFIASPGYLSNAEIDYWVQVGCPVFLSSLDEVAYLVKAHPSAEINVRLDSLTSSKPGIKYSQLSELSRLLGSHRRSLNSFELYCGSSHSPDEMIGFLEQVFMIYRTYFPDIRAIDLAGGYGFQYEVLAESGKHFDWEKYFKELVNVARRYGVPDSVEFVIEPARDLLADVGVLVLGVKREVVLQPGGNQLVTDGSRVLMPSAQYKNRRHNVVFCDQSGAELPPGKNRAVLRGRGLLRHEQILPGEYRTPDGLTAGSLVIVLDAGAYCSTQHMEFLNIPPAPEVLIDSDGSPCLITSRGGDLDKWRHLLDAKQPLQDSVMVESSAAS